VNNLNQLTGIPSGTPSYDTNGNLTSDGGALTCQYDDENQLISVESIGSWPYTRTEFEYDGKQRLRIRT
jgi:YD repeat-containing protein